VIRVHGAIVASEVDGPGVRAVVHFAGCSIRCPGCFNRALWAESGPGVREVSAADLAAEMLAISPHVTISGGEPTDQPGGLLDLLIALDAQGAQSVVLFTGRRGAVDSALLVGLVDVVVEGRFDARKPETAWLRGSTNQGLIVLSGARIAREQLRQHGVQVHVDGERLVVTGFPSPEFLEAIGGSDAQKSPEAEGSCP
jgi:anaerobic ribonucleoside-triphosphate reductase activating protein